MVCLLPPTDVPEPEFTVAVPSTGRAGRVLVSKMMHPDDFVVVVPPDEIPAYREQQPELQFEPYPHAEGNVARKWQWMYDRFGSVLIVDDDLDKMEHHEHVAGEKRCTLDQDQVMQTFRRTAWECAQAGLYMFGYGILDIRNFDCMHPFRIKGVVMGAIGLLAGSKISYNQEIGANIDFWGALVNAYHHRCVWVDNRYSLTGPPITFVGAGGMSKVRTLATERKDWEVLRRYFGEAVQKKGKTHRLRQVQHDYAKVMVLPY